MISFYKNFKNVLNEQQLINESLEKLQKIYAPKIKEILDKQNILHKFGGSVEARIKELFELDPTHTRAKGEMFAKNILNMFIKYIKFEAYGASGFERAIISYFETIRETPPKTIGLEMKSLNQFDDIYEVQDYVKSINDKVKSIELKKKMKNIEKSDKVYSDEDWNAYFIKDERSMINMFKGKSDWCVSKGNGYWNQYTEERGLLIVFENLKDDIEYDESFILTTLMYDDEYFEEVNNLKNNESYFVTDINDLLPNILENIFEKYSADSIREIGEQFYDVANKKINFNDTDHEVELVESVFGIIPTLGDRGIIVDTILVDSEDGYDLLENVIADLGSKFFINEGIYIDYEGDYIIELIEIDTNAEIKLELSGLVGTIRFISSDIKVSGIDINSEEQVIIEGYDTDNTKIKKLYVEKCYGVLQLDSVIVNYIDTGESCESLSLINSTVGNIKLLSGDMDSGSDNVGSTVETIDVYTENINIVDCKNYNIHNPKFTLDYSFVEVNEHKEQTFNLDDTVKSFSIQDDIPDDIEKIIITGGKALEELIIEDEDIIINISQETFMSLKNFEGDKDNIEFSKFDREQSKIIWEILKLKI